MGKFINLTGKTFGRLTVLERHPVNAKNKGVRWICKCSCGNQTCCSSNNLINGNSSSCGCLHSEITIERLTGNKSNRTDGEISFWNLFIQTYKKSAKRRNIGFSLQLNEIMQIANQNCYYCGFAPVENTLAKSRYLYDCKRYNGNVDWDFAESKIYKTNGLDRIDNTKGYSICNVVPCCSCCNYAKRDMTLDKWDEYLTRVTKFRNASCSK